MSTQPLRGPGRHSTWGARRPEPSRLVPVLLLAAFAFMAAYVAGYAVQRSKQTAGQGAQVGSSRLPALATPVPTALTGAPPIEVGVQVVLHTPARATGATGKRASLAGSAVSPTTVRSASPRASVTPATGGDSHGSQGGTAAPAGGGGAEPSVSFDSSG